MGYLNNALSQSLPYFAIVINMKSMRSKLKHTNPISSKSWLLIEAEKRHIQAHLALTELRLRIRGCANITNRRVVLDMLNDYWKSGIFPINSYKPDKRTPVFVDTQGTYCAVGHLMVKTGHRALVNKIDQTDKFVLVEQLNHREVEAWLNYYGLSREEAALIQPGYGGFVIERVAYTMQEKVFAILTLIASLLLVAFVIIALRLIKSRTVENPKKLSRLLQLAIASAFIVAGLLFYLPTPSEAVSILIPGPTKKETIVCGGPNTPKNERPAICNEFEQRINVPGWQEVPCEGICIN
jgi:hypothetical protein